MKSDFLINCLPTKAFQSALLELDLCFVTRNAQTSSEFELGTLISFSAPLTATSLFTTLLSKMTAVYKSSTLILYTFSYGILWTVYSLDLGDHDSPQYPSLCSSYYGLSFCYSCYTLFCQTFIQVHYVGYRCFHVSILHSICPAGVKFLRPSFLIMCPTIISSFL